MNHTSYSLRVQLVSLMFKLRAQLAGRQLLAMLMLQKLPSNFMLNLIVGVEWETCISSPWEPILRQISIIP